MEKVRYRKILRGIVVSDRMDKTRSVQVTRTFRHPLYHKVIRKNKKYHVHDEKNQAHQGDSVEIRESRPFSKLKRWRLIRIVKKAKE